MNLRWIISLLFIFSLVILGGTSVVYSQTISTIDSTNTTIKSKNVLDTSLIHKFAKNPDFQYKKNLFKKSFIGKIWKSIKDFFINLINKILRKIFGVDVQESTSNIIFWILILIILAGLGFLFYKSRKQLFTTSGTIFTDDDDISIEQMNYVDKQLEAYQNLDFRMAIRYALLNTIKQLDENKQIVYVAGKTLYEYQSELSNKEMKDKFSEMCYIYEYIWFGNFTATMSLCDLVISDMNFIFNLNQLKK
jgi:predicted PurR-regulated permease PerM